MKSLAAVIVSAAVVVSGSAVSAQTGGFVAVLDKTQNNGDSRRSVVFFDTDDLSAPIFSVFVGAEGGGGFNYEDPDSITVNPATGDVYVLAFDSPAGAPLVPASTELEPDGTLDTQSDLDLYRIDFSAAYNAWQSNGGTYMTFGRNDNFDGSHAAPQTGGPFPITKIGEIGRSPGREFEFFSTKLEFINDETLVYVDAPTDYVGETGDVQIRAINKVGGAAAPAGTPVGTQGGFNNGTAEAWESALLGYVNLDGFDTSEVESLAAVRGVDGVTGVWITERDRNETGGGDAVAFFEITNFLGTAGNGYRAFAGGGTTFEADNDPATDDTTNDGDLTDVFVTADGDLVFVESGFTDGFGGGVRADGSDDPGVFRRTVTTYDNGNGEIALGAWGGKTLFDTTGIYDDTTRDVVLDGRNAVYNDAENILYILDEDNSTDTDAGGSPFAQDWYALDLDTGVTSAPGPDADFIALFNSNSGADDQVEFFFLVAGIAGDYNASGQVEQGDLDLVLQNWGRDTVANGIPTGWTNDLPDGLIDQGELDGVLLNWGSTAVPSVGGTNVPEPAAFGVLCGWAVAAWGRGGRCPGGRFRKNLGGGRHGR